MIHDWLVFNLLFQTQLHAENQNKRPITVCILGTAGCLSRHVLLTGTQQPHPPDSTGSGADPGYHQKAGGEDVGGWRHRGHEGGRTDQDRLLGTGKNIKC